VSAEDELAEKLAGLRPRLLAQALKLHKGDRARAEDLVQTAFEKALRNRARFEGGTSLEAWLAKIVTNQFLDDVRSARAKAERHSVPIEAGREPANPEPEPLNPHLEFITMEQVRDAVEQLGPKQRLVFIEFHFNRKSYQEIADEHGFSKGTVASLLSRARVNVRKILLRESEKQP